MSNTAQSLASTRIASLLDENSFVEIGGQVTARSTDFNMAGMETPKISMETALGKRGENERRAARGQR